MKKYKNTILGVLSAILLFSVVSVPAVNALTLSDVELLIALGIIPADKAEAARAAVGGTTTNSNNSCFTITRNLTIGSSGADVTSLQTFLESKGYLTIPPSVAKGYFGGLTQAALARYQLANSISPAVGYFGPITRSKISADCSVNSNSNSNNNQSNNNSGSNSDNSLKGGAGSIENADFLAAYSNEEVGENAKNVEVLGLEIEASEGSDIELTSLGVKFTQNTADRDFRKYASEVSVLFDGKTVATANASDFKDSNNYSKTLSLNKGAVIKAGKTGNITIAVSGANNIDSNDFGESWDVSVTSIRFKDAQGAIITENSQGDIGNESRTFTFESFASASNLELKIQNGDDSINDTQTVKVSTNSTTKNVDLFSFKIKINGNSDIKLKDLPITSTISGTATNLNDVFSKLYLEVNGTKIASENPTASTEIVFDGIDYILKAGKTYELVLVGDVKKLSSSFAQGDTVKFSLGESETDSANFKAEDSNGDRLQDSDVTGSVFGEDRVFFEQGIQVSLVSQNAVSYSPSGEDNDRAELKLVFDVTNFGDDSLYIPDLATFTNASTSEVRTAPNTSEGIGYAIQFDTATTSIDVLNVSSLLTSNATKKTNSYEIRSGDTKTFTLIVKVTNKPTSVIDGVSVRALLSGIGWSTTDSSTSENVYTVNLKDIETDYAVVAD